MIILNPRLDARNSCSKDFGAAQFAPSVNFKPDYVPVNAPARVVASNDVSVQEVPIGGRTEPLMPDTSSAAVGGIFAGSFVVTALLIFVFWFFTKPKITNESGAMTLTK